MSGAPTMPYGESQRPQIAVRMDEEDFEHLTETSAAWGSHRRSHGGRFEAAGSSADPVDYSFAYAYWVGQHWTTVLLARAFLDALGETYQIVGDLADPAQWVILTNWESPVRRRGTGRAPVVVPDAVETPE